jgi:5-methyltetrahydropteroyltriglutamate--homocysteine methyltransferase
MNAEPIRTTHTGSLPRPEAILRLLAEERAGRAVDAAEREALLAQSTAECVDKQIATGVDVVSDGELSKPSYATYVKDRLTGFGGRGAFPLPADLAEYPDYAMHIFREQAVATLETPACIGPVTYGSTQAVERDIEHFRRALRGRAEGFLTAASPGVISLFLKDEHYPSHEAYVQAIADAMRVEYRAIHDAGLILQIDCPDLAMGGHVDFEGGSLRALRKRLAMHAEALNHAVADIPPDRMRIHLCWGNYAGPHHRDVALKDVVDIFLSTRPQAISFVAANPRHEHEWKVWADIHVPDDKVLVPGVVDSTCNFIEHPELVAERLSRFARIVGEERVMAGTDCGMSTFAGLHVVDPAIAWAKLEALVEGARIASRARKASRPEVVLHT